MPAKLTEARSFGAAAADATVAVTAGDGGCQLSSSLSPSEGCQSLSLSSGLLGVLRVSTAAAPCVYEGRALPAVAAPNAAYRHPVDSQHAVQQCVLERHFKSHGTQVG